MTPRTDQLPDPGLPDLREKVYEITVVVVGEWPTLPAPTGNQTEDMVARLKTTDPDADALAKLLMAATDVDVLEIAIRREGDNGFTFYIDERREL